MHLGKCLWWWGDNFANHDLALWAHDIDNGFEDTPLPAKDLLDTPDWGIGGCGTRIVE